MGHAYIYIYTCVNIPVHESTSRFQLLVDDVSSLNLPNPVLISNLNISYGIFMNSNFFCVARSSAFCCNATARQRCYIKVTQLIVARRP